LKKLVHYFTPQIVLRKVGRGMVKNNEYLKQFILSY